MELTEKQIKAIKNLGWSVRIDNGYCLENYSPCGGDMVIEEDSKEEIISYCERFDPNEEFKVYFGANNGEPHNPGALWEDCLEKQKMYNELAKVIKEN